MYARQNLEEVEYDLDKPRTHHLITLEKAHHNTVNWCNLKLAQRKGSQFYQTRSHAITVSSTLPAICREKVVCIKIGEEPNCKVHQSPRLPRVTLVPNSQHNRKDVPIKDSRKSDDCEHEVHKHRETCSSSRADFQISRIPHSTVEQVETNRKETVGRLIEQFENHPNRTMLQKDFGKSEEINHFSQETKDLITEMGNTEIFEFYETSSKRQCPDCALHWAIGIVFCTCGKHVQPTEKSRHFNKDRFDILSIPEYVIKKNQSRGPRHGPSLRQTVFHKARGVLGKAKNAKNGHCRTVLERWYKDAKYRADSSEGSEEYTDTVHPRTGWKYYPSTSSSSSSHWEQQDDWKSNQSSDSWRSSTWTEQKKIVEKSGKDRETCCRGDSDSFCSSSGSCSSLAGNFQFRGNRRGVNRYTSHTAHFHMYGAHSVSACHIAPIPCTTSVAQGQADRVFRKNNVHPSRAMSLAMHGTLSTSSFSFSSISGLQRFLTSRNPCADSQEPRSDGYTDPEPRTDSPAGKWANENTKIAAGTCSAKTRFDSKSEHGGNSKSNEIRFASRNS